MPLVSVPLNAQDRTESVATGGANVTYPSTSNQHENTITLLNHFLLITIRIKQLRCQVIVVRIVTTVNQLLAQPGALAILVY